jgi:hypothetical protein
MFLDYFYAVTSHGKWDPNSDEEGTDTVILQICMYFVVSAHQ